MQLRYHCSPSLQSTGVTKEGSLGQRNIVDEPQALELEEVLGSRSIRKRYSSCCRTKLRMMLFGEGNNREERNPRLLSVSVDGVSCHNLTMVRGRTGLKGLVRPDDAGNIINHHQKNITSLVFQLYRLMAYCAIN